MIELIIGLASSVIGIALFISGFLLGTKFSGRNVVKPPEQDELEKLKREQDAFQNLMSYNADTAYNFRNFDS